MQLLFFLFLVLTYQNADLKLARVNGIDGLTLVRAAPNASASVIDTLRTSDFFYCEKKPGIIWCQVSVQHSGAGEPLAGFIPVNNIQWLEDLEIETQKAIVLSVLEKEKQLIIDLDSSRSNYIDATNSWATPADSIRNRAARIALERFDFTSYSSVLNFLSLVFCRTKDPAIVKSLIETILMNPGSANEIPSYTIGRCFICNPALVGEQIKKLKQTREVKQMQESIQWGLLNVLPGTVGKKSQSPEFVGYKNQLDKLSGVTPP